MSAPGASGLRLLLNSVWQVILPLISVLYFCRKCPALSFFHKRLTRSYITARILWFFYRHRKDVNEFFSSSTEANQDSYLRTMALGFLELAVVLPISIISSSR